MKKFLGVTLVVLLAGAMTLAPARVRTGTLAGMVLGPNGKPVAGARVTIETADGREPHATTTNAQGRFFFPMYAAGYYNVRAFHKGEWSDWRNNLEIKTGKQTEVTLRLHAGPAK